MKTTKKAYESPKERPVNLQEVTLQFDPATVSFDELTGKLVLAVPCREADRRLIPMLEDSLAHAQLSPRDRAILLEDTLLNIRELQVMAYIRGCYVDTNR